MEIDGYIKNSEKGEKGEKEKGEKNEKNENGEKGEKGEKKVKSSWEKWQVREKWDRWGRWKKVNKARKVRQMRKLRSIQGEKSEKQKRTPVNLIFSTAQIFGIWLFDFYTCSQLRAQCSQISTFLHSYCCFRLTGSSSERTNTGSNSLATCLQVYMPQNNQRAMCFLKHTASITLKGTVRPVLGNMAFELMLKVKSAAKVALTLPGVDAVLRMSCPVGFFGFRLAPASFQCYFAMRSISRSFFCPTLVYRFAFAPDSYSLLVVSLFLRRLLLMAMFGNQTGSWHVRSAKPTRSQVKFAARTLICSCFGNKIKRNRPWARWMKQHKEAFWKHSVWWFHLFSLQFSGCSAFRLVDLLNWRFDCSNCCFLQCRSAASFFDCSRDFPSTRLCLP